jgi:hypothetical protein
MNIKNNKTIINNPCSKSWDEMTEVSSGKFCGSCKKTVVDFTAWKDDDIKKYLLEQSGTTCGQFNKSQVDIIRPRHHQFLVDLYFRIKENIRIPVLKTIALQLIIVSMFVIGCNNPETNSETNSGNTNDDHQLLGVVAIDKLDKLNPDTNSHNPNHSPKEND